MALVGATMCGCDDEEDAAAPWGPPAPPAAGPGLPGADPTQAAAPAETCANVLPPDHTLSSPTRWTNTPALCDYLVQGLSVASSLDIEPGTVVQVAADRSVHIASGGLLMAIGRPGAPISLIGSKDVRGFWNGVRFASGSRASRLEHVEIRNAGQTGEYLLSYGAAISGTGTLTLRHSRVSGSRGDAATFVGPIVLQVFEHNVFEDNERFGVVVGYDQVAKLDLQTDYVGRHKPNGEPYIFASNLGPSDGLRHSGTWRDLGAPYYISSALAVHAALTLAPGVRIAAEDGSIIRVTGAGSLTASGTMEREIVFTTAAGGDSWQGLSFYDSTSPRNVLERVRLENTGGGQAAIAVGGPVSGSTVRLSSLTFAGTQGRELCADDGLNRRSHVTIGGTDGSLTFGDYLLQQQGVPRCFER